MNNQNQPASPDASQGGQPTIPQEPTAPQEPITPKQPQPNPKFPTWLSVLGIVIAAVIVLGLVAWGGYELFKPAPSEETGGEETEQEEEDEFADWKTYRNEEYGFEVQYPGDLVIEEGINYISLWIEKDMQYLEGRPRLAIGMYNLDDKSFEEWIQHDLGLGSFIDPRDGLNETGMKAEDIFIDNKKGLKIHEPGPEEGYFHHYISSENSIIDIVTVREKNLDEIFNQILSTFKFLD